MKRKGKKRTRRVPDPWPAGDEPAFVEVDPDEFWESLLKAPEHEQITKLSEGFAWYVILADLDNPREFKTAFWKKFYARDAFRNRHKAIYGASASKNQVAFLIAAARAYEEHELDLAFLSDENGQSEIAPLLVGDDGREWDAEMIGNVFARWVCSADSEGSSHLDELAKQFRNLAAAEKTRAKRTAEGYGEHTNEGLVWRAFCQLVLANKRIPTEREIGTVIPERWKKRSIDPSQMGRICNSLGISQTKTAG